MICKRCGNDVAPTKYCSKCGTLLNIKQCQSCGSPMGANETYCAICGSSAQNYHMPALPSQQYYNEPQGGQYYEPYNSSYIPTSPYPAAPANAGAQPSDGDNQVRMRLKKRPKHVTPTGNKHTVLRGLLGALGCLGALGVMVYFVFFAGLLADAAGNAFSPLLFSPETFKLTVNGGSFTVLSNYQNIIDYFTTFAANIGSFAGDNLWNNIPVLLFQLTYFVALLMLAVSVLIALIRTLSGLVGKKEFDLMLPVQLSLGALLSMFIALLFVSADTGVNYINYQSGLMFAIYAGFAAIAWQTLMNIFRAGSRFFKAGSFGKWLTNAAFFGGAALMLFGVPLTVTIGGSDVSPITWFATNLASVIDNVLSGGEMNVDTMQLVMIGSIAITMIGFIWGLSSAVAKTGKRLARTFKFDGYADKGCFLRGLFALSTAIGYGAFVFFGTDGGFDSLSQVYMFAGGGLIMFLAGLFNRLFLNRDQL